MAAKSDLIRMTILVDAKDAKNQLDGFDKQVKQTTDKTTAGAKGLKAAFSSVAVAVAAVAAAGFALDKFFTRAQEVSGLARGFNTLTKRVGESADMLLGKMRDASVGFISNAELMKQANNAIILGLPVTAASMGKLTDAALKLGQAMGVDANRALESLVVGIGRQSKLWLDNIGIIVDADKAYSDFAKELGKSASELTDAEKKLAFYNATVAAAELASKGLVKENKLLSDTWIQMKTDLSNYIDELVRYANSKGREGGIGVGLFGASFALTGQALRSDASRSELRSSSQRDQRLNNDPFAFQGDTFNAGQLQAGRSTQQDSSAALQRWTDAAAAMVLNELSISSPLGGQGSNALGNFPGQQDFGGGTADTNFEMFMPDAAPMREFEQALEDVIFQYGDLAMVTSDIDDLQHDLAESGLEWTDALQEQALAMQDAAAKAEMMAAAQDVLGNAVSAVTGALIDQAIAGELSADSLGNTIARAVKDTLKGIAQQSAVKAIFELAEGIAAAARYDSYSASLHFEAARQFGVIALGAGAGAVISGRASGSSDQTGRGGTIEGPGERAQEVHVFIEGQGFIQNTDEFARFITNSMNEQNGRAGV